MLPFQLCNYDRQLQNYQIIRKFLDMSNTKVLLLLLRLNVKILLFLGYLIILVYSITYNIKSFVILSEYKFNGFNQLYDFYRFGRALYKNYIKLFQFYIDGKTFDKVVMAVIISTYLYSNEIWFNTVLWLFFRKIFSLVK